MPPRTKGGANTVSAEVPCSVFASDCVVGPRQGMICGYDPDGRGVVKAELCIVHGQAVS